MKNLKYIVVVIFLSLINFAQTPTPIPKGDDVVKIETNLIQLDAVVTDKEGNEVTNLQAADFEVYENGELVKITDFSYILVKNKTNAASLNQIEHNDLGMIPPRIGQIRRTVAIVVDDYRLSHVSLNIIKKSLVIFISEQVQPNDLVAIIKTSGSIGILQQFTTDKKKLLNAINNLQWKPLASIGTSAFPPIGITFSEQIANVRKSILSEITGEEQAEKLKSKGTQKVNSNPTEELEKISIKSGERENVEKVAANYRNSQLVTGTLKVLLKTIEAMNSLAGRKSIFFVGEGLNTISRNEINSMGDISQGSFLNSENSDLLRNVSELANRSAISIYSFDPRGVQTLGLTAETATRGGMFESMTHQEIGEKLTVQKDAFRQSQEGLRTLAQETGGKVFLNSNDLENGLKSMLNSQNGYYLLAYQPDSDTFDANNRRFNKLIVKVKRPNVNVTYRSGFFNVAENSNQNQSQSDEKNFVQKLLSPYRYDEVNLNVTSVFAGSQNAESTLRTFININPSDLKFVEDGNGKITGRFDILVIAFEENGIPIAHLGRTFSASVNANEFAQLLKTGLLCNLSFNTKATGIHQIKVAVRDVNTNKIGTISHSINVPNAKEDELAMSGILFENLTVDQFKSLQNNTFKPSQDKMQQDTALRQFKKGTILTYNYVVYVFPKIKESNLANLNAQIILWKSGKEIFRGSPEKIDIIAKPPFQTRNQRGAFMLGTEMEIGHYVLQIIVGGEKQSLSFELVD